MLISKAFGFTGDGPAPSPAAARIYWPVRLNAEYRPAAVRDPDATAIAIGAPGVILAARSIAQSPLQPNPPDGVGPAIRMPTPLGFAGDALLSRVGTIRESRIFRCGRGNSAEEKEGNGQEDKRSERKESPHSNLLKLVSLAQEICLSRFLDHYPGTFPTPHCDFDSGLRTEKLNAIPMNIVAMLV